MTPNHLAMRSGNPALSKHTFSSLSQAESAGKAMTIEGTVNKTALSLLLLTTTALYTWNLPLGSPQLGILTIVGILGGLGMALVTIFKKHLAPYTVPGYALLEGFAIGAISSFFEAKFPGIVTQAVFLTFGTLGALLIAYRSGWIKATENFKLGVFAATGGIALIYMINFIMGFFGPGMSMVHSSSTTGILFSVVVVVIAALNLVLDFDFIEEGAESGAPAYMEWYGAFGLLVTLIWLYLEILRLLAKLNSRR